MAKLLKASYTVEAALTIPMLLFVMFFAMQMSFQLYDEICTQQEYELVEQLWEVRDFYRIQGIGELTSDK